MDETLWTKFDTYGQLKLDQHPKIYNGSYDVDTFDGFQKYMNHIYIFNETASDHCFLEILTSGNAKVIHKCSISDFCKKFMTSEIEEFEPEYIGYGVTHR